MDSLIIKGGTPLKGTIRISGAKNAALPLMAACLLSDQPLTLTNLPVLADIGTMKELLSYHGVALQNGEDGVLKMDAKTITDTTAPYDIVRKMRASILVLGPLVARFGKARVSLPGGCAIGNRPIDLHLHGLEALGATIHLEDGYVEAVAPEGLKGAVIRMPSISVGATENILMATVLAKGTSVIENAALEPEITDLAKCLIAMGAKIEGLGTDRLTIHGVTSLKPATYAVMADRIEAGSYAIAAAITGGALRLEGVDPSIMGATIEALQDAGVEVVEGEDHITVTAGEVIRGINVRTQPYPGFATDMQAQFMALMCLCEGAGVMRETIFENRFMHVPELTRMGANITVEGNTATVRGVKTLKGAPVMATDLRASMSLVLAALAAEGTSVVNRIYHLDRGYEKLEQKLVAVGADITRAKGS